MSLKPITAALVASAAAVLALSACDRPADKPARADRAGADEVNWNALIEEARRERLGKIDEQAEAEEADAQAAEGAPPR